MQWFYAKDGQQAGPVDDAELDRLVQSGTIADSTLVWHSGLANWQPYAAARVPVGASGGGVPAFGSAPVGLGRPTTAAGPGQTQCSQCGRVLPADDVVRIENSDVCAECKPLFLQRLREVGVVPGGALPFAGFWIRCGAAILDGLILIPFYLVIGVGAYFLTDLHTLNFSDSQAVQIYATHLTWPFLLSMYALGVLLAVYSAFCVGRYGGTPGKRICGLRVVHGLDARPATFWRGLGRYAAKALPRAVPILGRLYLLVDALFIAFDSQKRGLHDMMCDTRVVHDNPV